MFLSSPFKVEMKNCFLRPFSLLIFNNNETPMHKCDIHKSQKKAIYSRFFLAMAEENIFYGKQNSSFIVHWDGRKLLGWPGGVCDVSWICVVIEDEIYWSFNSIGNLCRRQNAWFCALFSFIAEGNLFGKMLKLESFQIFLKSFVHDSDSFEALEALNYWKLFEVFKAS